MKSAAELLAVIEHQERQVGAQQLDEGRAALSGGRPSVDRYPECLMPIAGAEIEWPDDEDAQAIRVRYEQFCEVREAALTGYGFNTARAYWADLEDIFWWAERRGFAVDRLSTDEVTQYVGLLRRRRYSENTIRRRIGTWRSYLRRLHTVVAAE